MAVRMGTSTLCSDAVASAKSSNASVGPHSSSASMSCEDSRAPSSAGIFVTLSDFTEQARAEARTTGITLVNNRDLKRPHPKCAARGTVLDLSGCDGA